MQGDRKKWTLTRLHFICRKSLLELFGDRNLKTELKLPTGHFSLSFYSIHFVSCIQIGLRTACTMQMLTFWNFHYCLLLFCRSLAVRRFFISSFFCERDLKIRLISITLTIFFSKQRSFRSPNSSPEGFKTAQVQQTICAVLQFMLNEAWDFIVVAFAELPWKSGLFWPMGCLFCHFQNFWFFP